MDKKEILENIALFKELIADEETPKAEVELYKESLVGYEKKLEEIEAEEKKPSKPKVKPKTKDEKPKPKKKDEKLKKKGYNPFEVDLSKDRQGMGKTHDLVKQSDSLYLITPKNEEYSEMELEKKDDGKWHITCTTSTEKTFKSLQGAINYISKVMYSGELKKLIDDKKSKDKKKKEWDKKHPTGLTLNESLKKEADVINNKQDDKAITKTQAKASISGVSEIVKAIKDNMATSEDGKKFLKDLIKELTSLLG